MENNYLKFIGSFDASRARLFGCSEEYIKFLNSGYECLNCNKILMNNIGIFSANFYSADGAKIDPGITGLTPFRRDVVVECPHCTHRWNMYANSNPIKPNKLEFVSIVNTRKSEEILGIDQKVIDNSKSTTEITEKYTFSIEWAKTYSIQYEKIKVDGKELNIGIKLPELELANIKATSEETLKKQYSVSEQQRKTNTEEVQITVREHTKSTVCFTWKRILQHSIIKIRDQDNKEYNVPFTVTTGVNSDLSKTDERSEFLIEE